MSPSARGRGSGRSRPGDRSGRRGREVASRVSALHRRAIPRGPGMAAERVAVDAERVELPERAVERGAHGVEAHAPRIGKRPARPAAYCSSPKWLMRRPVPVKLAAPAPARDRGPGDRRVGGPPRGRTSRPRRSYPGRSATRPPAVAARARPRRVLSLPGRRVAEPHQGVRRTWSTPEGQPPRGPRGVPPARRGRVEDQVDVDAREPPPSRPGRAGCRRPCSGGRAAGARPSNDCTPTLTGESELSSRAAVAGVTCVGKTRSPAPPRRDRRTPPSSSSRATACRRRRRAT